MTTQEAITNYKKEFDNYPPDHQNTEWIGRMRSLRADLFNALFSEISTLEEFSVEHSGLGRTKVTINHIPALLIRNPKNDDYKSWLIEMNIKERELHLIQEVLPFVSISSLITPNVRYTFSREELKQQGILV